MFYCSAPERGVTSELQNLMQKTWLALFRSGALAFISIAVASAAPITFTLPGAGGAVADVGAASVFNVSTSQHGTVTDVKLWFRDISHTWIGALIVTLEHAARGPVDILNRVGVPGSGSFGLSWNLTTGGTYRFADGGTNLLSLTAIADIPYGTYAPAQLLSTFNGADASGTWLLRLSDNAIGDVANTTWTWGLDITAETPEPSYGLGVAGAIALLAFVRRRN
jgi:subtilisin-like proprotein convertase family protein